MPVQLEGTLDWGSTTAGDITTRGKLFDDMIEFGNDGTIPGAFKNIMDGETWVENWQDGASGGNRAPVAPHDGSDQTYTYQYTTATENGSSYDRIKVIGTGAHVGLPKATNNGEITSPGSAPTEITYDIFEITNSTVTFDIYVSGGWWRFKYVRVAGLSNPPDPDIDAADVISLFGDTYDPVPNINYNPNWAQNTTVVVDDFLHYNNLNYQGMEFESNPIDLTDGGSSTPFTHLHIDFFTIDSTELKFFLIGNGEQYHTLVPDDNFVQGQWVSVDIPLSVYTVPNLSNIIQTKVEGNGSVKFDNIYFYKQTTEPEPEPEYVVPQFTDNLTFGGFRHDSTNNTYTFPSSAQPWAGVANENSAIYPLNFENGGKITFNYENDSGSPINVRFRLEFNSIIRILIQHLI